MSSNEGSDRFGYSEEFLASVRAAHGGLPRMGLYVPTRYEVGTMPSETLGPILEMWLYEGPAELIPSEKQIRSVLEILLRRPDRAAVRDLIAECHRYLST